MANQPGYQTPGQSNAAGSDSGQNFQQNQISGTGYGPNFFGQAPQAQPNQASNANNPLLAGSGAANNLLLGQFQNPMSQNSGSVPQPSAAQPLQFQPPMGQPASQLGNLQVTSGGASSQPTQSVTDGAVGYYADSAGNAYVVYSDGSVVPIDGKIVDYGYAGGKEFVGDDVNALKEAGVRQLTAGEVATAQTIDLAKGLSTAGNMYQDQFNELASTDVGAALRQAQRQQLDQIAGQRQASVQNALRAQRMMGLTGAFGSDLGGVGAQFSQAAGNVNIQAQQAIDDAEADKEEQLFLLRQQARDETERGIQKNVDVATGALNSLDLSAQNMSAETGKKYAVNPNLRSELNSLISFAQTRNINSAEFARLVAQTTAKYGSGAYVLVNEKLSDPLGGASTTFYGQGG